jgi:predicted HAD superfamily Cof-like phosphohydrolase
MFSGSKGNDVTEFHPIQTSDVTQRGHAVMPSEVTLRAYEVYCALYGEQPALVDLAGRGCRGGFGVGELVAFLYARSFPKTEWRQRFDEAIRRPQR